MINQYQEVATLIERYFAALYQGDVAVLASIFAESAVLAGEVKGQAYCKRLPEYLEVVGNRKSPEQLAEPFAMKIVSIEILNHIALVKTHCPMLGFIYCDYLSLVYRNGNWLIASKLFIDI